MSCFQMCTLEGTTDTQMWQAMIKGVFHDMTNILQMQILHRKIKTLVNTFKYLRYPKKGDINSACYSASSSLPP